MSGIYNHSLAFVILTDVAHIGILNGSLMVSLNSRASTSSSFSVVIIMRDGLLARQVITLQKLARSLKNLFLGFKEAATEPFILSHIYCAMILRK